VLTSEAETHVFVDLGEGRFAPRPVRVGEAHGTEVEVVSGLAEGERVASAAAFMIDAESQLRAGVEGAM
jgi:Cu(I)/Ag(I) efflux system membrane fusion protein